MLDRFEDRPIEGTANASAPFFSPDGTSIAFFADGLLRRVSLAGGPPVTICELPAGDTSGGSWGTDGRIVFAARPSLYSVRDGGGVPEQLTSPDPLQGELIHEWPQILPGSRHVLFTVRTGMIADLMTAAALSVRDGTWRTVLPQASHSKYLSGGYLVSAWRGALSVAPFDLQNALVTGSSVRLIEGVATGASFALADNGSLVYLPADSTDEVEETYPGWLARSGGITPIGITPRRYVFMGVSPNAERAVLTQEERGRMSLVVCDLRRGGALSRLPLAGENNHLAVYSPDATRLVYTSDRDGPANLYWQPADGSGSAERLVTSTQHQDAGSFSADGRLLAYAEVDPESSWDIWVVPLDGDRRPIRFRHEPHALYHPTFSPDAQWIAYTSQGSGARQVWVERFPGPGDRFQASTQGGWHPLWSPDGRTLYYQETDAIVAVELDLGEKPHAGQPRKIVEAPLARQNGFSTAPYAVLEDGRFFVLFRSEGARPAPSLRVVLNWVDELQAVLRPR
jgi:Tol biopolymer transport system component